MSNKNHSEFVLKLEGIKLSEGAERRIEKGIQSLVLQELASFTPNPDDPDKPKHPIHGHGGGGVIFVPIKWPGGLIKVLDKEQLQKIGISATELAAG